MKAIVLGGNGMVGKKLIPRLKQEGYEVLSPTRLELDLDNQFMVGEYFKSIDTNSIVFLLAAKVGGIKANMIDPYHFLLNNLNIQNNVIRSCLGNGIKRLIFLGSSCIYPRNATIPITEEALLSGSLEETNLGYSLAKISGLKLCEFANKQYGTNFISLMPSNLYGPGDHFDLETSHALPANIMKVVNAKENNQKQITLWGNGEAKREWLYVDDLVDCMIWALNNIKKTETFLNVGTGWSISMIELVKLICEVIDYKGDIILDLNQPNGMPDKRLNVNKINSLGWSAKTDLRIGIEKTAEYYKSIRI